MGKEQFDVAFASNTYHHIDHRINYLKKVQEGLNPGGRFVVVDFKTQVHRKKIFGPPLKVRISITQVVQELYEASFGEIIIHSDKLDYQYVIIGVKSKNKLN
jgi:ubiquinone/menaquinone biosynthesis C-methylase UbiE